MDAAIWIFNQSLKMDAFRSHSINLIAIMSLFYEMRRMRLTITLDQILAGTPYKTNLAMNYYYQIMRELKSDKPLMGPDQFLLPICSTLQLNQQVIHRAEELLRIHQQTKSLGVCDPKGLAGEERSNQW